MPNPVKAVSLALQLARRMLGTAAPARAAAPASDLDRVWQAIDGMRGSVTPAAQRAKEMEAAMAELRANPKASFGTGHNLTPTPNAPPQFADWAAEEAGQGRYADPSDFAKLQFRGVPAGVSSKPPPEMWGNAPLDAERYDDALREFWGRTGSVVDTDAGLGVQSNVPSDAVSSFRGRTMNASGGAVKRADGGANGLPDESDLLADRMLYGAGEYTRTRPDDRIGSISRTMPMLQRGEADAVAHRNDSGVATILRGLGLAKADGGELDTEAPNAQTFLSDLARNPKGWGTKLPLQAEMRSSLSPEAERIGAIYGPEAGHYYQGVLDASDKGKDVALGVSGLGLANEGMDDVVAGSPGTGAAKIGLAAAPFMGPIGRGLSAAARYAPKATGLAALIGGATAFPAMGGDKVSLDEQLKRLEDARDATAKQRDLSAEEYRAQIGGKSGRKAGPGPLSTQMDAQLKPLNDQITDFNTQIAALKHQMTPEYAREQDLAQENVEARKPWYERTGVPGAETAMTWAPPVAAAVLARYKFNAITDEGVNLLNAVKAASSIGEEARARVALEAWRRSAPMDAVKAATKAALIPGSVRTTGTVGDAIFGPEVKDAQGNVQAGGAKEQARDLLHRMFTTREGAQSEFGPQLLQGAEAVATGALFSRRPPMGDIKSQTAYLKGINNPEASTLQRLTGRTGAGSMSPDAIAMEMAKRRAGVDAGASSSPAGPQPLWSQAMRAPPTNLALPPPKSPTPEYPGSPTTSSQTVEQELGGLGPEFSTPPATGTNPAVERALSLAKARPGPAAPESAAPVAPEASPSAGPATTTSSLRTWRGRIKTPHGWRYKAGAPESVGGRFAEGPKSAKKQSAPKELTNGKEPDTPDVEEPKKGTSAEDYFNDPSKLTGGMKTGGAVGRALSLARKYAPGGSVLGALKPSEGYVPEHWSKRVVAPMIKNEVGPNSAWMPVQPKYDMPMRSYDPQALNGGRPQYANGGIVGPLVGNTGGRSDKLARSVPAGSHVIPADVVGHLGEGNSLGGLKVLEQKFGSVSRATGGEVPVMLSDGEFVVSPEAVAREGGGDPARGHAAIDRFILGTRRHAIQTLKSLPPPSQ